MNSPKSSRLIVLAALAVWLIAVGVGLAALWKYALSPGPAGAPPSQWPAHSQIAMDADRDTLVLFAHPHCPCSRATVGELARLSARVRDRLAVRVVFVRPLGVGEHWAETDLWQSAAAIPGVDISTDEEGREARRFGVETSGHTLLYSRDGDLLFDGGITSARGHAGDNDGETTVAALVSGDPVVQHRTPVFGCALFGPDGRCAEGTQACDRS